MNTAKLIIKKLLLFISIGAIFVSVSEFWFYPTPMDVSSVIAVMFAYGIAGYLFLLILTYYNVAKFAGLFVAAALFGFIIEGIPVPVLYSQIPFSIVWTSLAWHALITVCAGWYWFRKIMAGSTWLKVSLYNLVFGVGLGTWGGYIWNVIESEDGEVSGWRFVSPELFAEQFIFGWVLFVLGHILFSSLTKHGISSSRLELTIVASITALFYAILQLVPFFPFSIILPLLVYGSILLLRKNNTATNEPLPIFVNQTIAPHRYIYTLLIPIGAISVYSTIFTYQIKLEANVILILTAGPLAVWLWLQSMWKLYK